MQKTTMFKRIMTLFLVFVMVLGILPISEFVSPAIAAEAKEGPPPTTEMVSWKFYSKYDSPVLKPSRVIPRTFIFSLNDGVAPGFCADHTKDVSTGATWSNPVPIEGTKYEVIKPLIAAYNYTWFYSRELDDRYPNQTTIFKKKIAEQERGSVHYYWDETDRISASSMSQAGAWLAGQGLLTDLSNHDQQLMIAHERNLTTKTIYGSVSESDEEVAGWVAESIGKYENGDYGEYQMFIYTPPGGKQPIITSLPPDTIPKDGWFKLKKTDLSGNALSGATFAVYTDAGHQNQIYQFITTADEWTYVDVSRFMDSATKTFYLKEISAPPDYVPNGAGYTVTVSSTNNSTKETAAAVNGGVAIKNGKSQPPSGVVQKVDPDGNGIGPATFHFKKLTPNAVDMDIPCDETGTLKLQWEDPTGEDYIEPGEYTVTEVIPPPGYEMSEESQNLRLWLEDKDGDGIQEPYSSGPIVFQNQPKHTVIIQKVDETGNGLPGAVFDVYFNGAKVDSVTTGPDGTFNYTGTDGNGVSTGTWEFVETKAPSGYLIPYMNYQSVTVNTL